MSQINLIATAAFGIESIVARELKKLNFQDVRIENGRVMFTGDEMSVCKANLWSRCADRIFINMGEFEAYSFEDLFQGTKAIKWEDWLPKDAEFPVSGKSISSDLHSVPDCQAIVKKAIVERLKQKYNIGWFEETGAKYPILVSILKNKVTVMMDASGEGLHKRGYRPLNTIAPLRETLAAAIIDLSRWEKNRAFMDPMCGSGTFAIEAAMIGTNTAPGLFRSFSSDKWPQISTRLWQQARDEAESARDMETELRIIAQDIDPEAVKKARKHLELSNMKDKIHLQVFDAKEAKSRYEHGYIVVNPPYGERIGEIKEAEKLYRDISKNFLENFSTWSYHVLSSHQEFEYYFGRKADKLRKLYNGKIRCDLYQYYGPKPKSVNQE